MTQTTFDLHGLLSKESPNLKEIKDFLEKDNSSIKYKNRYGTPLTIALKSPGCSLPLVKLLLEYGANPKIKDLETRSPLLTALQFTRDVEIIALLLEHCNNYNDYDSMRQTPLRYIFSNREWNQQRGTPEWKENVLNLLLKAGLDLNELNLDRQSPLCFTLWEGADVHDIELLLRKGATLNACQKHATPLHCLLYGDGYYEGTLLRESVVQFLLDKRAAEDVTDEIDLEILLYAVRYCRFETGAIELLLKHSDENEVNTFIRSETNFLHMLVGNKYCKLSIVELFLKRGGRIDQRNSDGETLLHTILTPDISDLNVLEFLLKKGVPVNQECNAGKTPLGLAVHRNLGNKVINMLLAFGAKFVKSCDRNGISLLERSLYMIEESSISPQKYDVFKTLVKYYFLEFPDFNIRGLIEGRSDFESLSAFAEKCAVELERMELKNIRSNYTLRRILRDNALLDAKTDQEIQMVNEDCNQLEKILFSLEFNEYFDVIAFQILASKAAEEFLKKKLQSLKFYVEKTSIKADCIIKLILNYDCVCRLAGFLSDVELFNLVVAFYHPDNNKKPEKRKLDSEEVTNFKKHTKL